MLKRLILVFTIIFIIIFSISAIYNVENKICTKEDAIKIAQQYVTTNNKETFVNTITNFEVPDVEIIDKKCYKVTFNYPLDLFAGPYDVYVDYNNGKCYGTTLKY